MRRFVDVVSLVFGVYNLLAAVQPKVSREHVAEGDCQQKIRHSVIAEQLKADKQGSDWTVCDTAEYGSHADCGAQCRGEAQQIAKQTAKSCTGEERRNDFATLISGAQSQRREYHFQEESLRTNRTVNALFDDIDSGTVIVLVSDQKSQDNNDASADKCAQIGILKKAFV